jgi:hypothetical protein
MSRDELRSRPEAERPAYRDTDRGRALWPRDPHGGGTWVAAADSGLTLALLNVNLGPHEPPNPAPRTRGELIPRLIEEHSIAGVAGALREMPLDRYRPFRLVAISSEGVIDARWDRRLLVETARRLEPACFVSSGLGDHFVEPRLMLFESMVRGVWPTPSVQDAFHRHVWPGHEDVSVMMSRKNARTTSVTTVDVAPEGERASVTMIHRDDQGESSHELRALVAAGT